MRLEQRRNLWIVGLAVLLASLPVLFHAGGLTWTNQAPYEQSLTPLEQGGLVLAVYLVKLVYMLLGLAALFAMSGERGRAWRAIQASLAAFWAGEFFCAINILFYIQEDLLFEYLHSVLMVACVGLLFYGVMEAADESLLHFSSSKTRCALSGVCKTCIKGDPAHPCLLHRLFAWMMPLGALLAFMPLMAEPLDISFNTQVFGFPRTLIHLMPIQWYELRFSPAAALVLMAAGWAALVWRGHTPGGLQVSKVLLAFGVGHLGFTLMRAVFAAFYRENLVWFFFWEELTELMLVGGVVIVFLLLRPGLAGRLRASVSG